MYLQSLNTSECSGCGACLNICPAKCITKVEDRFGFVYPKVNSAKCLNCGLCREVCPMDYSEFNHEAKVYIGKNKERHSVLDASSGGAFEALYKYYISNGYVVCGAIIEERKVRHSLALTLEECGRFRKSKYVQSDTENIYNDVYKYLKKDHRVLFSGTPCQCAALLSYLKAKHVSTDNILLCEVLCHGVPSQLIFCSYLNELEKRSNKKVQSVVFRNKKEINGRVNSRSIEIVYCDGTSELQDLSHSPFLRGYHNRLFYRESCAKCPFARRERVADITLADAWGADEISATFNPEDGVSMILINTEKGNEALQKALMEEMFLREVPLSWACASNDTLRSPTVFHKNRSVFFDMWEKTSFSEAVDISLHIPFLERLLNKIKRICGVQ